MIGLSGQQKRFVKESIWVFSGKFCTALGTLAGLRMLTEVVEPKIYGTVVLVIGLITLAQGLTAQPLMQAVLRFYPEYKVHDAVTSLRKNVIVCLRYPVLIVLLLLGGFVTAWSRYLGEPLILSFLCVMLFILGVLRLFFITFLNAARDQRAMAILMSSDAWFRPSMAVAMVWLLGSNTTSVLWGYSLGAIMVLSPCFYYLRKEKLTVITNELALIPSSLSTQKLWKYAIPLIPLSMLGWISGQADRYMLGIWTGLDSAGQYAAFYGLGSRPFLMLSDGAQLALRQPYYEQVTAGNSLAERRLLKSWLLFVFVGSLGFLLLFILLHKDIARLTLGAEYRTGSDLLVWIGTGYLFVACARVVERVCYAYHDTKGVLFIQVCGAIFSLVITAPMVFFFGLRGAAWAVPIYFGAQFVITLIRAYSVLSESLKVNKVSRVAPRV